MSPYWYVDIRPTSPWLTPWQADTLLGHFCWLLARFEGEAALRKFLEPFLAGTPRIVLSDGMLADRLVAPLSLPFLYEDPEAIREARSRRWLSIEQFNQARQGRPVDLAEDLATADQPAPRHAGTIDWEPVSSMHVGIDRRTLNASPGLLYSLHGYCLPAGYQAVRFYVWAADQEALEPLHRLFKMLSLEGYGKRKTVGFGAFEVPQEPQPFTQFPEVPDADAVVSLSNFVPAASDPAADGLWKILIKFGRLGEHRSAWPQPFKRSLRMLQAGSVLKLHDDQRPPAFLGRAISGLSIKPDGSPGDDVQICYGLALPCRWPHRLDLAGQGRPAAAAS